MPPLDNAPIDFESLADVMCAAAIRSGDVMLLDRIADLPSAARALHATQVISQAAQADPWIAKVLNDTQAVHTMRAEIKRRRSLP